MDDSSPKKGNGEPQLPDNSVISDMDHDSNNDDMVDFSSSRKDGDKTNSIIELPDNNTDYSHVYSDDDSGAKYRTRNDSLGMRGKRSSYGDSINYRNVKESEFRDKRVRLPTEGDPRFIGIFNDPLIYDLAKRIVENVHELDKALERLHIIDLVDKKALVRVAQQDPYIARLIIDYFEKTCNPKAKNPSAYLMHVTKIKLEEHPEYQDFGGFPRHRDGEYPQDRRDFRSDYGQSNNSKGNHDGDDRRSGRRGDYYERKEDVNAYGHRDTRFMDRRDDRSMERRDDRSFDRRDDRSLDRRDDRSLDRRDDRSLNRRDDRSFDRRDDRSLDRRDDRSMDRRDDRSMERRDDNHSERRDPRSYDAKEDESAANPATQQRDPRPSSDTPRSLSSSSHPPRQEDPSYPSTETRYPSQPHDPPYNRSESQPFDRRDSQRFERRDPRYYDRRYPRNYRDGDTREYMSRDPHRNDFRMYHRDPPMNRRENRGYDRSHGPYSRQ